MNNSFLAIESVPLSLVEPEINIEQLRDREADLVNTITAIQEVRKTKGWSTLKANVFDGFTEYLKSELTSEARKESPDALKLNRIAGQLKWAERYSDLGILEEQCRAELINLRRNYGKTS